MFRKNNCKGFTLIELLVVVAIIGLLSSIVMASLNSTRVKSRNAFRLSQQRELNKAFNLGISDLGSLPSYGSTTVYCIASSCYDGWASIPVNATIDSYFTPYIQKPIDPAGGTRGSGGYLYLGSFTGGTGHGSYVPPGNYISVIFEQPMSNCGAGMLWATTSNYHYCFFPIN